MKTYFSFWQWHHGVFLRLKEACQFSHFACILYGTWLFLKTGFYILVFREQYLRHSFTLSFEYVVAETIIISVPFIFRSYAGIMLIFHLQSGISELYFPFPCNLYGKYFGISVTHLTSDLEVPGSSPGVSNNFFSQFFYFLTSSMIMKIEDRPPNSSPWRIKFLVIIIYLFSVIYFVRIFFLYFPFFVQPDNSISIYPIWFSILTQS